MESNPSSADKMADWLVWLFDVEHFVTRPGDEFREWPEFKNGLRWVEAPFRIADTLTRDLTVRSQRENGFFAEHKEL